MTGRAVVERALALWNDHDREGFIACFAEDCEFNVPRRAGTGRAAAAGWWDFNATAFGTGRVRVEVLIESGETVAVEAVFEGTHTGTLPAVGSRREISATGELGRVGRLAPRGTRGVEGRGGTEDGEGSARPSPPAPRRGRSRDPVRHPAPLDTAPAIEAPPGAARGHRSAPAAATGRTAPMIPAGHGCVRG